jgi:ParB-like chromosome segregation protein Spo0J
MNHAQEIIEIPCEQIRIGERHRKEMGDLEGLAASIAREGLLQPVGITEDFRLVFGQRRLVAVQDILKWPTIPARVVRVTSLLAAEHDENEVRKSFTASERTAIASALEQEIGNRQGQRTDRQLQDNCPEVPAGVQTRELVAQKAGFNSYKTYERAKRVVEKAVDEVVAQMDAGDLSISAAAVIAEQPPERQIEIAQLPKEEKKAEVRKLRRQDLPTPKEARRQALESGLAILDRNLNYQLPTPESQRPIVERNYAAMAVLDGVRTIAACAYPAPDIAAAIRSLDTPDMDFAGSCRRAAAFLEAINEELERNENK